MPLAGLYDVVLCGGWRWDGMACRLDVVFSGEGRGGGRKDGDALVLFVALGGGKRYSSILSQ